MGGVSWIFGDLTGINGTGDLGLGRAGGALSNLWDSIFFLGFKFVR